MSEKTKGRSLSFEIPAVAGDPERATIVRAALTVIAVAIATGRSPDAAMKKLDSYADQIAAALRKK